MSQYVTVGQYPGLGMDLRYHAQDERAEEIYPIGFHHNCYGSLSDILLVREVAMMIIMDRLTDNPNWHVKVFDDTIAEKWIEDALKFPVDAIYDEISNYNYNARHPKKLKTILDRGCLEYCIQELRAKARYFEKTGLIPTMDACVTAVKSDTLIDEGLHDELRAAFAKLKEHQKDGPDWRPLTNQRVRDLVDPSLYPLIYGKSRGFRNEVVGVEDAVDRWSGKGEIIPSDDSPYPKGFYGHVDPNRIFDPYWSTKYQWLPSNVKFQEDGSVKFTSYINGLHPNKHREIYRAIEKLVERALPAWDFCLLRFRKRADKVGAGRTKPRFPRPINPDDENEDNWTPSSDEVSSLPRAETSEAEVDESASNPASSDEEEGEDVEVQSEGGHEYHGTRKDVAWKIVRQPVQPEAPEFKTWNYAVGPGESLHERFKDIQIIIRMTSIELTPENSSLPAERWHVEGQMNEHIISTALYHLDSENVTPTYLQLRMQTSVFPSDYNYNVRQGSYNWLERVYGTNLGYRAVDSHCLQRYGSVEIRQGRLLAFPNVFNHRVSSFELQDKTKPGHSRFIALLLVDPSTRIINTGNVPPQQQSWWMENAFSNLKQGNAEKVPQAIAQLILYAAPGHSALDAAAKRGEPLPAELMAMIHKNVGQAVVPMSLKEAKGHRLKLMEERTSFQAEMRRHWAEHGYGF